MAIQQRRIRQFDLDKTVAVSRNNIANLKSRISPGGHQCVFEPAKGFAPLSA